MAKYSNGLEDSLNIPDESVKVLEKRYLKRDNHGKLIETGEDMLKRVARDISAAEVLYDEKFKESINPNYSTQELYNLSEKSEKAKKYNKEFFDVMKNRYFLPNSPTLMNAGRELQQLSACFVLPIGDSMEEIFETQRDMAVVHKSGGGTGFSFSNLRPNGAYISSTSGYSPGPVSFLFTYNESAGQITQGGKRRGANMGVLNASHPDALDWAIAKKQEGVLSNFNLSIAFTDEDIESIKKDDYILMKDPRGKSYGLKNAKSRVKEILFGKGDVFKTAWALSEDEKSIISTYSKEIVGKVENGKIYVKAKKLFDMIVQVVWERGEPGVIFLDKINKYNPTPKMGKIESTNPCGEQPLLPYESCNLGSINLAEMINGEGELDESLLEKTVRTSIRFLDNVIDRNKFPLQEIEKITKANRKIGLGVMGFAHMLIKMGISYNSTEAVKEAEDIMRFINSVSKDESYKLAKEKGEFPNFKESTYKDGEKLRNATTTTIAPTGTIGVIASSSQGIEPIYALVSERNVEKTIGQNLIEVDREFKKFLEKEELYDERILGEITKGKSIDDLLIPKTIKNKIKSLFVIAHDVPAEQHLKIQAAFQKYTDNAVSKTINIPFEAKKEDVANAYLRAHELGCKGVTIYRDGSRDYQLLTSAGKSNNIYMDLKNGKRPNVIGTTKKQKTPLGNAFVTLNVLKENSQLP